MNFKWLLGFSVGFLLLFCFFGGGGWGGVGGEKEGKGTAELPCFGHSDLR